MDLPEAPVRLRRAEAILRRRTSRLVLVMERPWNDDNVQAVLRTAESFGVQHIWTIQHPLKRARAKRTVTKGSHLWLSRRVFPTIEECVAALRAEGMTIWATDLGDEAEALRTPEQLQPFPERLALVVGRELQGVSEELLEAADRRLFLDMGGFTESLNLSVATALMLQRCFDACPELVGAMPDEERNELRRHWYERLAGKNENKREIFLRYAEQPPEPLESTRASADSRKPRVKKKYLKKKGF